MALKSHRRDEIDEIKFTLLEFAIHTPITLQWIPAHCGIGGNEEADSLAKKEGDMEQDNSDVTCAKEKAVIETHYSRKWREKHPGVNKNDACNKLDRADHMIIFKLRTGHNRLNYHMFTKLGIGTAEKCPCGAAAMTSQHILQECMRHDSLKQEIWPKPRPMEWKLHGNMEELQRTIYFVRQSGETIP